jgi:hypothetical protein
MAEFIDISDFGGVVTNVDVEDLPEHIAQNMENLRIRDGKLEKTFGAGQPSDVPIFALSAVNTKLTRSYVVYNVFTFISDKLGTTEHRYILVLIDSSTKQVKLFWYDPDVPAVNDHLQVEDNILYFQTASDSGYSQSDNIMVVGVKDNNNSAIANTDIYDDITYKTGNKHFINTDTATTWGGSFFATASDTGLRDQTMGGKHGTHLNVDTNASAGISSFTNIALLALNGKVLCMYSYDSGSDGRIKYTIGSSTSELNTTLYNQFKGYGTFKVNAMINHSDAIWVYYSALDSAGGGQSYNAVVKYTVQSNGTIVETGFDGHDPSESDWGDNVGQTFNSGHFYTANTGTLYLLIPGNDSSLFKVSGANIVAQSGVPANTSTYEWKGITSITNTVNGNKEYLVLGESSATNHKLHYIDLNDNSATWANSSYSDQLHLLTKMDFGENNNKNESIIKYYERSGGDKFLQYSTHNDATVILGFADVNGSIFTTSTVIEAIKNAYRHPSGTKYLMVCTNDSGVYNSGMVHGRVYRIDASKTVVSLNDNANDTYKGWNPTCIDDVVTGATSGNQFFTHAKAYIQAYGVEYTDTLNNPRASLIRMTDIGWGSGTWAGTGTVDYGWTDLHSKYNFYEIAEDNSSTTPTIYHQTDKNPIVPTGDTVRFIPGAIGKVSSTEAKGLWLGYINRSMFNGDYTIPANWYGYVNTLNNPFKVTLKRKYKADTNLRNGDTVKYNCTAVYDGVQESLFDKNDELILDDNDIQKHIVELDVEIADITALNKRITGINFYRAIGNSGIYSNYQLIGHMTFVDSGNNLSSVGAIKDIQLQYSGNEVIYVKATNTSQRDGIRTRDYNENWLGTNKYAIDTDGGFDGIDDPDDAEYFDPFDGFLLYMTIGTIRPMTSSQLYVVATSNNVADSIPLSIEDEIVTTATTAVPSVPLSAPVDTGLNLTGSVTWATTDNPKTFYVDGDATNILKAGDKIQLGTHNAVITLTAVSDYDDVNTITQIVGNADINGSASGTPDVKLREVASGEHIIILSARGADEPNVSPAITTSAVAHNNGVSVAKQREHNYTRLSLDENANFGNSYLDGDGNFNGSSWKIKRRRNANYTTTYNASSGAYGGNNIGVVFPIDYADFNNNITANSLSGSIVFFGEKSVQIEGNSSFDSDIGGVWVKTTESFGASDTSTISQQAQLLEGFSVSTAQGSTTPGMGFTKDGDKVTITCRDFRLEDLGETPTQTIYSNRVNGQYARELKGRLFLGNVVLNPEDKAEEHRDWIAYSELNEFDTIPVSNVIAFDDREGGDITGLAVLFGRLVIFKPQAIFILNVSDPSNSNSWAVVESKHNIGNVAPQGVVEVHDSIYFVYHDGIYRVTSNMVASSTATPSVMDKVSDKIDDQFLLATDKTAIKGLYDPSRQEVIYKWMEGNTQRVWAYNYVRESWRKINMGTGVLDILAYDETGVPLNYDKTSNKIIKFDTANASVAKWKSKRFPLDLHRKRLLRYGTVQFTGTDDLTYNIYLDGATSASFTKTISADGGINRFPIKRYAKKFEVEIATASSTNALTLERLQIEME